MGRNDESSRVCPHEVSPLRPPSEDATSDEDDWMSEKRASTSVTVWPRMRPPEKSFYLLDSELPDSVIPEECLPVARESYQQETLPPEVQLWSAALESKLTPKYESFLEEAFLQRSLGQDQTLAMLFLYNFDLKICRNNVKYLRNTNLPTLNEQQQTCFRRLRQTYEKDFPKYRTDPLLSECSVKELVKFYYHMKLDRLKVEVQFWLTSVYATSQIRKQSLVDFLRKNKVLKTRAVNAKENKNKNLRCDVCLNIRREIKQVTYVTKVRLCQTCVVFYSKNKRLMEVPVEVNENLLRSPPKRIRLASPSFFLPSVLSDKENKDPEIIFLQSTTRKVEGCRITEVITID